MLRNLFSSIIILLFSFNSISTAFGDDRVAIITTTSGKTIEFSKLYIEEKSGPAHGYVYLLPLLDNKITIYISLENIVSIEAKEGNYTIIYKLYGEKLTIDAKKMDGCFSGTSEYGNDTRLVYSKVKSLKFKTPPLPEDSNTKFIPIAKITLNDGEMISADSLKRFAWALDNKYVLDDALNYEVEDEIKANVKLSEIKSIHFKEEGKISITLKNGKTHDGKVDMWFYGIDGFFGNFKKGSFYIDRDDIKVIDFLDEPEGQ